MEHLGMNAVDLAVIVVLALSGLLALIRGLVRELVVLAVWIGSVVASAMLYPLAKPWMSQYIKNEMGADAAAALVLFCATLIILIPVGHMISSLIKGETLTAIDRSLGFVFGVLRGLLVVCLLYLGASWVWPDPTQQPVWLQSAKARPVLITGANIIKNLVPKDKLDQASADLHAGQAVVNQTQEHLDTLNKLSTLVPTAQTPSAKPQQAPNYNDNARSDLERLINEKGKK